MESNELRESLREAERGEASTWIDYPPTPRWWAPMFGAWSAVLAANIGYVGGPVGALVSLALAAFMGGVIAWQRRVRGTFPTGRPPRELNRSLLLLAGGAAAIGMAAWLIGATVAVWLAVVLAGVGSWALVAWYERAYARDAERVRRRLR
jgi:hypothetical protein